MSESIPLRDYLAAQPPEFQAEVAERARRRVERVADRQALRAIGDRGLSGLQADPATRARAERRAALALRTLRRFVALAGGDLDITARLPGQPPIRLDGQPEVPTAAPDVPTGAAIFHPA